MKIAYGPPGAVGVKNLQYLSATEDFDKSNITWPVLLVAGGAGVYSLSLKNKRFKRRAQIISMGALVVWWLTRK